MIAAVLAQSGSGAAAAAGIGSLILFLIVFAGLLYFVPAVIAIARKHSQLVAILAVNILLGWTFLGWVVALVWSLTADKAPVVVNQTFSPTLPTGATTAQKMCPYCHSSIPQGASVCRYCQRDVTTFGGPLATREIPPTA